MYQTFNNDYTEEGVGLGVGAWSTSILLNSFFTMSINSFLAHVWFPFMLTVSLYSSEL